MTVHYDIAIVGGGLVGVTLALALRKTPLRVALFDQSPVNHSPVPVLMPETFIKSRALALSQTSKQILQTLGLWQGLSHMTPIRKIHVSERHCWGMTQIHSSSHKLPALGYVLPGEYLLSYLQAALKESSTGDYLRAVRVSNFVLSDHLWNFQVQKQDYTANLLVAADGTDSSLRTRLNIPVSRHDYQETALICNLALERCHQHVAYERFTDQGTIALLPFGEALVKCVWSMDQKLASLYSECSEEHFLKSLQEHFGYRLGKFLSVTARAVYPLQQVKAQKLYEKRVVLVGNAANTLHPIAAQGFNLGIRDVAVLAELLVAAKLQGQDLGSDTLLEQYASSRASDHQATQKATHHLSSLATAQSLGMKLAKSLARFSIDVLPLLKAKIAKSGMGLIPNLPKLARGIPLYV